jgi:hypothetical protein
MPNMSRIRKAQEETRQKKLRDTPVPVKSGKTTAAQYSAAYGTVNTPQGGGHRGRKKAQAASKLMSTQSASGVIPDDEIVKSIKAKREKQKGVIKNMDWGKGAMEPPSTPDTDKTTTPGTDKTTTPGTDKTATKKKRKKHTKRRFREDARKAVVKKNKKPKTKKTKKQKELEAAYGSPKDTERMMKGKNLKEGLISKLSKKLKKGK